MIGTACHSRNITERKIQEATLKKQYQLEIKNKELEQFAYLASHDLQEPLRTVSNYMQVFEEDYSKFLDDKARTYLTAVNNATKRMSILIKSLLNFSKLGLSKKLVYVDFKNLVREVIIDIETLITNSNVSIEIAEMPKLIAYETEIRQVFQNLIINAIKFRRKDVPVKIKIYSEKIKNKWRFSVSDNGIGIDAGNFEKIFEIFQRLHTREEYEGTGIGLANCKKIVELHHGEIWLESIPGQGSIFHFTI